MDSHASQHLSTGASLSLILLRLLEDWLTWHLVSTLFHASDIPIDVNACLNFALAAFGYAVVLQPVVNFLQTTLGATLCKFPKVWHLPLRKIEYTCHAIEVSYVRIALFPVLQWCLEVVDRISRCPLQVQGVAGAYEYSALL
jgi:hypothetical protein